MSKIVTEKEHKREREYTHEVCVTYTYVQVSVRWASGHEHHGTFEAGRAHGAGMHIFPDGARLSCCFARGRPVGTGSLMDNTGAYYDVEYGHDLPGDMHTPGNEEAEGQDAIGREARYR